MVFPLSNNEASWPSCELRVASCHPIAITQDIDGVFRPIAVGCGHLNLLVGARCADNKGLKGCGGAGNSATSMSVGGKVYWQILASDPF
jgi:hypothetical protein